MYNFLESKSVNEKKQALINQIFNGVNNDEISIEIALNKLIHCALMEMVDHNIEEHKASLIK